MSEDPKPEGQKGEEADNPAEEKPVQCACIQDPFAALPPELRPRQRSWTDGLRKVTCPGCGRQYWTNRETDYCMDCEKKVPQKPSIEPKK